MDKTILKQIGMTNGEISVYFALLDLGSSSTGSIIKTSQITSSKVYLILNKLEEKGLVSHVIKNNVKYFQVAKTERLLDYMTKKENKLKKNIDEVRKIIPQLEKKRTEFHELQETTMFKGYKGFVSAIKEITSPLTAGEEYVVFGTSESFGKQFEPFIKSFYKEKEKHGIKTRLLYNSDFRQIKKLYTGLKLTEIKFIDYITPATVVISKNQILLISYGDDAMQVLIKSEPLAKSFTSFFDSMWRLAKN